MAKSAAASVVAGGARMGQSMATTKLVWQPAVMRRLSLGGRSWTGLPRARAPPDAGYEELAADGEGQIPDGNLAVLHGKQHGDEQAEAVEFDIEHGAGPGDAVADTGSVSVEKVDEARGQVEQRGQPGEPAGGPRAEQEAGQPGNRAGRKRRSATWRVRRSRIGPIRRDGGCRAACATGWRARRRR